MYPQEQPSHASGFKRTVPSMLEYLHRYWQTAAWVLMLAVINWPLIHGEVRTSLLFLPAAVKAGQWWRMASFPLIHLSWYHLLLDAGGFLLVYHSLEERRVLLRLMYVAGAGAGSLLLTLALEPEISHRGLAGLSGVAHGLMAVSALEMLRQPDQRRWGVFCFVLVAGKSIYELYTGQVVFAFMHMGLCGHPLAASHAGGVIGALWVLATRRLAATMLALHNENASGDGAGTVPSDTRGQQLLQHAVRLFTRIFYRVGCRGVDQIPDSGPAVLVCNHVSYVDALIIAAACRRPVHFVMHAGIYRLPVLNWIFRLARVIPIDSGRRDPATLCRAFKRIGAVLQAGGLVCIFPEGHLTRNGEVSSFRPGVERIVRRHPVPVIPLALRGLWGSFFSHRHGPAMGHWPRQIRKQIELVAGPQIQPESATARYLQVVVETLLGANS